MTALIPAESMGSDRTRADATAKVTGNAPYAYEYPVDAPLYLFPLLSTVAKGSVTAVDASEALALPGVHAVLTHENAPRLASDEDREWWVLQSPEVSFRGQYVGAVLAETSETARQAADLVRIDYDPLPHDVELRADRDDLYKPDVVNPAFATDTERGDVDAALSTAAITVDAWYATPMEHNNPMEPHTTVAVWHGGELTLYDSCQGAHSVRSTVAEVFGMDAERIRVVAPYVGGGFGAKGLPHANVPLTALAAQVTDGRPVKYALSRQQMFALAGHRTPTMQRVRLGADAGGRLTGLAHDAVEHTATFKEFAEQTTVGSRSMYACPAVRTTHRLAALDVPVPSWMRAPGEAPGFYALESAMDELAVACDLDPIELRIRNEPDVDPESGKPFSSRNLVACLREGATRFGWTGRNPRPGNLVENGWLVGTGVASSTYPVYAMPGSTAVIRLRDGRYQVEIGAADIGTGALTALGQVAADALGVPADSVDVALGDTRFPYASIAGGSAGLNSWGSTITDAAQRFRDKHGDDPDDGAEADGGMPDNPDTDRYSMHAYGAHFAEVRVHADTGEIRVPRMLGVFAAGRIVNPRTARSQFLGGMTMGLSMALHEQSVLDPHYGHVINHDFAQYHIASHADVADLQATWVDEHDEHVNPMGSKGIGEIGIVGSPAAIGNAVYDATGIRVRELPITPDKLLR